MLHNKSKTEMMNRLTRIDLEEEPADDVVGKAEIDDYIYYDDLVGSNGAQVCFKNINSIPKFDEPCLLCV
jgi:hypothetical protein